MFWDSRLAMTAAIRQYLAEHPDHFDPRQYLKPARENMKKMYIHKIVNVLGSDGKLVPVQMSTSSSFLIPAQICYMGVFELRVHGCHIAFKHWACNLSSRVSRVPQGCHGGPTPALPV